jgi:hypothetical protein
MAVCELTANIERSYDLKYIQKNEPKKNRLMIAALLIYYTYIYDQP